MPVQDCLVLCVDYANEDQYRKYADYATEFSFELLLAIESEGNIRGKHVKSGKQIVFTLLLSRFVQTH